MTTAAQAIPQEQMQKYNTAAEQFLADVVRKYPGLEITQALIDAVVAELKEMNLFRESISVKSFNAGFLSAVSTGKIRLPKPPPVTEMAAKLVSKFPPVVKRCEGSVAEKLGNAGVAAATGRMTKQDREESNRKIEKGYADQKAVTQRNVLRREYLELKGKAETAMGDNPRS